ncbi:MAG: helix-turn-helix domain-containing protein [Opitutae bacterium]|nr:helix-turn-helix domain-containing protein [Opitutae bacterium]
MSINMTGYNSPETKLFTKQQLADYLQISIRQLEKLVDAKKIPVTRLGKRCVRFDPDSVKQALSLLEIKAVRRNTPPPHSNKKSNAID